MDSKYNKPTIHLRPKLSLIKKDAQRLVLKHTGRYEKGNWTYFHDNKQA